MSDAFDVPPTAGEINEELARILDSPAFANGARARRFLTYVVEQTLAGQGEGIKELVLGTEVFDRGSGFDPRIDTIVRVEAGKLRKRLDDYYASGGAGSALRIDVPKGSYVPRFERRAPPEAPRPRPPVVAATASIAVLPFANFSPDPSDEYLADGLSEDLTDALSRSGLRVVARTSAYAYKGKHADVREIGARLNAQYVIEGSVRRDGERLKVTAQLVCTDDGYHVWSGSFERTMSDVLAVQGEIARTVVDSVSARLGRTPGTARTYVPAAEAFDLFLQAAHALNIDLDGAERLLRAAIDADPSYARPHVMLARVYMRADIFGLRPTPELVESAKAAVRTALALDEESAEAHSMLGNLLARHDYQWEAAEREMRRALELDPNLAAAHNDYAQNVLALEERWEEARAETRRALELDPLSPDVIAGAAFLLVLERDVAGAVRAFEKAVADNPGSLAVAGLVGALIGAGDVDRAARLVERAGPLARSPLMVSWLGYGRGRAGRRADAEQALRDLEAMSRTQFVQASFPAIVCMGLGDRDQAFRYLQQALDQKASLMAFLRVLDVCDSLRPDPRFATFLAKVNLTDEDVERRRVNRK